MSPVRLRIPSRPDLYLWRLGSRRERIHRKLTNCNKDGRWLRWLDEPVLVPCGCWSPPLLPTPTATSENINLPIVWDVHEWEKFPRDFRPGKSFDPCERIEKDALNDTWEFMFSSPMKNARRLNRITWRTGFFFSPKVQQFDGLNIKYVLWNKERTLRRNLSENMFFAFRRRWRIGSRQWSGFSPAEGRNSCF